MVGRDQYKTIFTVNHDLYDSQYCLMNNNLHAVFFVPLCLARLQTDDYVNVTSNSVSLIIVVELQNTNSLKW